MIFSGKKHFICLILICFFIVFGVLVSAVNPLKIYDSNSKEITILKDLKKTANYSLIYNDYMCDSLCFAVIEVDSYDKNKLFDSINFKDKNGNNVDLSNNINIYEKIKKSKEHICGIDETNCLNYNETYYKKDKKDKSLSLKKGTYIIEISADKTNFKIIDWIINAFENSFDEWAYWFSSTNFNEDFESDIIINSTIWDVYNGTSGSDAGNNQSINVDTDNSMKLSSWAGYSGSSGSSLSVAKTKVNLNTNTTNYNITFDLESTSTDEGYGTHYEQMMIQLSNGTDLSLKDTACWVTGECDGKNLINMSGINSRANYSIIVNGLGHNVTLYRNGVLKKTLSGLDTSQNWYIQFKSGISAQYGEINTIYVYNFTMTPFNYDTTNPNLTIIQPSGAKTSSTINYNVTSLDDYTLDYCYYNVTRGASVEVSNTNITCNSTMEGSFIVSGEADYNFNFFVNDTSGNSNYTNSSFSFSSIAIGGGSGGGGSDNIQTTEETKKVCPQYKDTWILKWDESKNETDIPKRITFLWNSFWDYAFCGSAASIYWGL